MYAGVGRANSTNSSSHDHEINADIPEWKKLLIMKKRASSASSSNGVEESRSPAVDPSRPHLSSPVITPAKASPTARAISGGTCEIPNSGNKLGRATKTDAETEKVVIPFSISAGETTILASNAVTRIFGNINVELRSVHRATSVSLDVSVESPKIDALSPARFLLSPSSEPPMSQGSDEEREDLQYGPGIVDKLRSRFLNMGLKNERKPVVRKFSSLENLSDTSNGVGPFRASERESRGERKLFVGNRAPNSSNHISGKVKKAQSMETLLVVSPDQHVFSGNKPSRRLAAPCNAYRTGLRSRNSPVPNFTGENLDVEGKGIPVKNQNGSESAHRGGKINTKREYGRQVSAPNINEEELPKPDTVKHFKKIFESPPANYNSCSVTASNKMNSTGRKIATPTPPTSVGKAPSSAICAHEKVPPALECPKVKDFLAKSSAKANINAIPASCENDAEAIRTNGDDSRDLDWENDLPANNQVVESVDTKALSVKSEEDGGNIEGSSNAPLEINLPVLSARSCEFEISTQEISESSGAVPSSSSSGESSDEEYPVSNCSSRLQQVPFDLSPPLSPKVTCEQLPEAPTQEEREPTQGSRLGEPERDSNTRPHPEADLQSHGDGMVVASREGASSDPDGGAEMCLSGSPTGDDGGGGSLKPSAVLAARKAPSWQKPPASTTSVVFDFRGKDVKPNISLKPAPFGCRPAKVARNKKRSGSPPRSDLIKTNGVANSAKDYSDDEDEEEDSIDELDIGADLPILSGIVFSGENVKIGKGSLLETRNKNLTIQFNDSATSTYEYPSEASVNDEPCPGSLDDLSSGNLRDPSSLKAHISLGPSGLSSYTPNVLSSNGDFEFGVSRPTYRHLPMTEKSAPPPSSSSDDIVPADPEDITGWSGAETSDILF